MSYEASIRLYRRELGVIAANAILIAAAGSLQGDEKAGGQVVFEPPRDKPQPGSIRLNNGLILSGLCSRQSTLAPGDVELDQRLELRMIDQGARRLYVSNRRAADTVVNPLDVPQLTFDITRKRRKRDPLPRGPRMLGTFDANGLATGEILNSNGEAVTVELAISSVNEMFAKVTSLTHDLNYAVSFDAIPRQHLYPGLLELVDGFDTQPFRRLELARMLIKANRLPEASRLLESLAEDFPELAAEQEEYQQSVREALARQFTSELELRRNVGQHYLASNGVRLHPQANLIPETVVRVNQLVDDYDSRASRIANVKTRLQMLVSEIADDAQRQLATELVYEINSALDEDSIDRFAAFELVARPDANGQQPTPDEQFALAASGWLLGADSSLRSLPESLALFEAQWLIADYLSTDISSEAPRRELLERLLTREGVSVDRIAALVRHMRPAMPVSLQAFSERGLKRFEIAATEDMAGAIGFVPPEYHGTRKYPIVIGFNGSAVSPDVYLAWWQAEAARNGFIVVVPVWPTAIDPEISQTAAEAGSEPQLPVAFDASADQHRQFLNLVRRLKLSLSIDDDRVFVAGHGQGGEAAMDMAASHPDLFAGIISICGLGRRHLQWTAWNAMEVPWYVVVGEAQLGWFERMSPLTGKLFRRSDEHKLFLDVLFVKYAERGSEIYAEEADDVFRWMALHRRVRDPKLISADLLRSSDLNWYWLKLSGLPEQFAQLDEPSTPLDDGFRTTALKARWNDKNSLVIESAPDEITLFISPDVPGYDSAKPLNISNGRTRLAVAYQPEITHLLERLYETADRSRLCFMRVNVPDRGGRR